MAQPGNFTPILLYSSSTFTNVPLAANLTNSTNGAEIAINIADKNLFFKDSGGTVNTVPIRQSGTSSNGWLSSTDWNTFNNKAPATSGTSLLYGNGSGGFSNVTIGSGITFAGGTLSATGSGGTVTSVTGTSPIVSSGGTTPAISLATAYGDTLNPYASKTANYFLAAPDGSAGLPTFRALVVADLPSLSSVYIPYTGATTAVDLNTKTLTNISRLGINSTAVPDILLRAYGDNNSTSRISIRGYSSDANSSSMRVAKFRGTFGAPQAPQSGDSLGKFELAGYGTTSSTGYPQASYEGVATENWGATARGAKVVFKVTPNNTTTQAIALTLDQDKSATFVSSVTATSFSGSGAGLTSIPNSALTNSTISGVALGGSLFNLTAGTGVSFSAGTTYNGSAAITINATGSGGTVTSVAALTLGTTGTDLSSTVANGTTTPVITLNVPTASATNRGALSAADWTTFNNKQPAGTYVTSVTGTAPVVSSGGTTPAISMAAATTSVNGYLTSTDWTTFNNKQAALVSGTNIKTVNGTTLLGSGDLGIITGTYGGTGVNNGTSTITIGGSVSYVGAYTQTWTRTANTSLTLPTSGYVISTATNLAANPVTGTPSSSNFLRGDGTWAVPTAGTGTVTSVAATVPAFLSISGSPITTSGTLAITLSGTALPVANGGTGVTTSTGTVNIVLSTSPTLTTPIISTTIGVGGATPSASGAGITFPATQSASTDPNTLDDYEEGTWQMTANPNLTLVAASSYGKYVKIGSTVFVNGRITVNTVSSINVVEIGGLPFQTGAQPTNGFNDAAFAISCSGVTQGTNGTVGVLFANTTYLRFYKQISNVASVQITNADLTAGATITFQVTYSV